MTWNSLAPGLVGLTLAGLAPGTARAQSITVGDHGFEATTFAPCGFGGFNSSSPWKIESGGDGGPWRPGTCWDMTPPEGVQIAYSNGGTLIQTLSTNATPGGTYTLSVLMGRRVNACCTFTPTTMSLWAGPQQIGSRTVTITDAPPVGGWKRFDLTATAPAGLPASVPLIIRLKAAGPQVDFDVVTLTGGGCHADYDGDGFVTGDDFDKYVVDFINGVASTDFDGDGFVTGDDFDAFVVAFEVGC